MSPAEAAEERLKAISDKIVSCRRCPRLVEYREAAARNPPRRYASQTYWAKPLPGFGDPSANILVIGLAPAAHGGNRTGRMFTGDSAGNTLARALHRNGLANIPYSVSLDDGLKLSGCYLTAAIRCAPPGNKPLKSELGNCYGYLKEEFDALPGIKVVVALGRMAFDTSMRLLLDCRFRSSRGKPVFRHGKAYEFIEEASGRRIWLIAAYHPSRRNTQTGLLTQQMLDKIFRQAALLAGLPVKPASMA